MKQNNNLVNESVPHLLTYNRSGMHFFDDNLYKMEKIHFTQSHLIEQLFDENNNKKRVIVTIAREPTGSIPSYIAHLGNYYLEHAIDIGIREKITEYILMYSFLCEHADYVIDFNDLIKYPKIVIKKLLDLLNIDKNKYVHFERDIMPRSEHYIPSSKSLPHYKEDLLDGYDLDLCYYYYHKLLEKKIII
jgi:hypothetical protein